MAKQKHETVEQPRDQEQPKPAPKFNTLAANDPRRREAEKERRRYVKRDGGFVKGLSPAEQKQGQALCEQYGRPASEGWDEAW